MRQSVFAMALALLSGCGSGVERSLIYHPVRRLEATPGNYGLPYRDVRLTGDDGTVRHGWYVPGRRPVTLLWFHGNAGNISHRLDNLVMFRNRLELGVLLFDYRGYGESGGVPSESGLYADALAFRQWLAGDGELSGHAVVYFGRSLGAAVATHLALEVRPAALVLESPFTSVPAMAHRTLPGAGYLFRTRFDTLARIATIRAPLLLLHGRADEVVPFDHGHAIFAAAPEPKVLIPIEGARHNDTYVVGGERYWEAWAAFLRAHVPGW